MGTSGASPFASTGRAFLVKVTPKSPNSGWRVTRGFGLRSSQDQQAPLCTSPEICDRLHRAINIGDALYFRGKTVTRCNWRSSSAIPGSEIAASTSVGRTAICNPCIVHNPSAWRRTATFSRLTVSSLLSFNRTNTRPANQRLI